VIYKPGSGLFVIYFDLFLLFHNAFFLFLKQIFELIKILPEEQTHSLSVLNPIVYVKTIIRSVEDFEADLISYPEFYIKCS